MKAIILAAGKGSRLIPLTLDTPKPLIDIGGQPLIHHIFESLPSEIEEVIIVVDHLKDKIKDSIGASYFQKSVTYVDQGPIRGTFGALLAVKDHIDQGERFLVIQGDDIHGKEELANHLNHSRSFGVQKVVMPGYHSVLIDKRGRINGFGSAVPGEPIFVATGAYMIDDDIFDHPGIRLRDGEYGLPQTLLAQRVDHPLTAIIGTQWFPVNTLEDLEKARQRFGS